MTGEIAYLLRLPVLRDCTGPHSSLPALGTAVGALYTHTQHTHKYIQGVVELVV